MVFQLLSCPCYKHTSVRVICERELEGLWVAKQHQCFRPSDLPMRRVLLRGSADNAKMSQKWLLPSRSFSIIGGGEVIAKMIIPLGREEVCKEIRTSTGVLKEWPLEVRDPRTDRSMKAASEMISKCLWLKDLKFPQLEWDWIMTLCPFLWLRTAHMDVDERERGKDTKQLWVRETLAELMIHYFPKQTS